MERKTAADFDPDLLILFDAYVHGHIDRRGFLDRATKFAVGSMTAGMLLDALSPNFAAAQQVAKDDSRIRAEYVEYPSPQGTGTMRGYLVRPAKATGTLPGVVVVHENRGLNPHIEDITRRLALDNFIAFAPDALTPLGGYPAEGEDAARTLFQKLDQTKTREDMVAAVGFLQTQAECTGRVGAVGFCYGGTIVKMLAARVPDLAASVPFYGRGNAAETATITAPLLIHYAGADTGVNNTWPAYEAGLKAAGVQYTMHMYDGAEHGFNNDTTPRYDEAAAKLAWSRTIEFFNKHVRR